MFLRVWTLFQCVCFFFFLPVHLKAKGDHGEAYRGHKHWKSVQDESAESLGVARNGSLHMECSRHWELRFLGEAVKTAKRAIRNI